MKKSKEPLPARMIVSAIYSSLDVMLDAIGDMEKKYGRVTDETDEIDFIHTTYYREEMGDELKRKFFAFEKPAPRDSLADIKNFTCRLEERYGERAGKYIIRRINLDPGILTLANLILASTKDYAHRLYLKEGIFAEVTLVYEKRKFRSLPWTYPDYMEPDVIRFLTRVRNTIRSTEFDD
jgi:hypothetical protein